MRCPSCDKISYAASAWSSGENGDPGWLCPECGCFVSDEDGEEEAIELPDPQGDINELRREFEGIIAEINTLTQETSDPISDPGHYHDVVARLQTLYDRSELLAAQIAKQDLRDRILSATRSISNEHPA